MGNAAKLKRDDMATSTYSTVIKIDDEQPSCSNGRPFIDLKTIKSKHYVQSLSIKKKTFNYH